MANNIIKDRVFTKNTGIVFASEVGSGIGAVITTPLLDKVIHNAEFNKVVAKLILPRLPQIEKATGLNREIHAYHDALHEGADRPYKELTPKERSERIADVLLNGTAAFLAENGISFALQVLFKKLTKADISPVRTSLTGASVHLGFIGVSATIASKPTEWVFHKIKDILPKITKMSPDSAEKTARNITYVITPGLFAFLAESLVANPSHRK